MTQAVSYDPRVGTASYQYDLTGRRTRMTWNDGFYVDYDYLVTGETAHIRENGATSGVGVLATYGYDDLGRRVSLTRGDGTVQSWGYGGTPWLTSLSDLAGTAYAQTLGFTYNPAGQIVTNDRSNNLYAWQGHYNVSRNYASNGLNQYTQSGAVNPTYDAKGNLVTAGGSQTYAYSAENQLMTTGAGAYSYYSTGELLSSGAASRTFVWDGADLITELDLAGTTVKRRYVHGPGSDEPLVWYEGSGTTDRRFLHADERGSIVAVTDSAGAVLNVNTYDEYGNPRSSNIGRFQYTGQAWLPEHGFYYYKARMYSPSFGRFMQPDPIGYGAGMNWYNYVGSDPINRRDPAGLAPPDDGPIMHPQCTDDCGETISVTGQRWEQEARDTQQMLNRIDTNQAMNSGSTSGEQEGDPLTVTGTRIPAPPPPPPPSLTPAVDDEQSGPDLEVTATRIHLAAAPKPPPANDNWLPGADACHLAKNICVGNSNSPTYDNREKIKRVAECRRAELMCRGQVGRSTTGFIWYPDGTIVFVIRGKATIVKQGPRL